MMHKKSIEAFLALLLVVSVFLLIQNITIKSPLSLSKISAHGIDTQQGTLTLFVEPRNVTVPPAEGVSAPSAQKVFKDFTIDQLIIKVKLKQGDIFKKALTITNPNNYPLSFTVSTTLPTLYFSEDSFTIAGNSQKTLFLIFTAPEGYAPGVYTGTMTIYTQKMKKTLNIIEEIESRAALFAATLNIPEVFKTVSQGGDVYAQTTLFNYGSVPLMNVSLEYIVQNFEGKIFAYNVSSAILANQTSFMKRISLPDNLKSGDYALVLRARYGEAVSSASDMFTVRGPEIPALLPCYLTNLSLALIIAVLIVLLILAWDRIRYRQMRRIIELTLNLIASIKRRINNKSFTKRQARREIGALHAKMRLLDRTFLRNLIGKGDYLSTKQKAKDMVDRLRAKFILS